MYIVHTFVVSDWHQLIMVSVPVKVTFNFDDQPGGKKKVKKTSSDESSTTESESDHDSIPDLEEQEGPGPSKRSAEPAVCFNQSTIFIYACC